jgi:hypothetical protein
VSRQFTDGEISAAIDQIATEGGRLSRTVVRKRLGGGSSSRIDALLKDYRRNELGAPNGASAGQPAAEVALPKTDPDTADPQTGATKSAVAPDMNAEQTADQLGARNIELIARLQSEIRILKILLESERKARADDAARHLQTIEALQHEIEVYRAVPRIFEDRGR